MKRIEVIFLLSLNASFLAGCGGAQDESEAEGETDADRLGVAAACTEDSECPSVEIAGESVQLECLTQFAGGYCALSGCDSALDCPSGATCVLHEDGTNYCFRQCLEKSECNANRPAESEANCVGSFDYADPADNDGEKACVPPSSGE